ncbi:unnamed protein product [Blepharisma stoltei]|uniref:Uncharacterized protein n=1 Tax=Blepharisma stoltei TaxID=1481888 RepID=A0AAU9JJ44_9CILI|nr:unnamed protein product [Blepharisma stoltei]
MYSTYGLLYFFYSVSSTYSPSCLPSSHWKDFLALPKTTILSQRFPKLAILICSLPSYVIYSYTSSEIMQTYGHFSKISAIFFDFLSCENLPNRIVGCIYHKNTSPFVKSCFKSLKI